MLINYISRDPISKYSHILKLSADVDLGEDIQPNTNQGFSSELNYPYVNHVQQDKPRGHRDDKKTLHWLPTLCLLLPSSILVPPWNKLFQNKSLALILVPGSACGGGQSKT
jgi:hypothetical protein